VAIAAGMARTPDLYMIDDPAPNAFAAGRDPEHAYVAVTTGIVKLMDQRELAGVLAHELSHIRNRDVRLMSLAAVLVGVIALASDLLMRITIFGGSSDEREGGLGAIGIVVGIVAAILAPIGASLLQMSLSRRREYLADASAVEITGDAEGLARALAALRADTQPLRTVTRATAHLYIESPLRDHKGLRSSLGGLFDTHPPLDDRIERLEEMGGFTLTLGPDPARS
jgi:heat shock protein HtpX